MSALPDPLAGLPAGLVWRGERFASTPLAGRPSGFPVLDAVLPGGGWPRGALIELLCARPGIGELSLLLPLMRETEAPHWLTWIAPPLTPYAPALTAAGIPLERLLWIAPDNQREARWATRQALLSGSCAMVLAWLDKADAAVLRRLQLAAEESNTPLFLFRPMAAARQSSPAVLRLQLEADPAGRISTAPSARPRGMPTAAPETAPRLSLRVLKRRGPLLAEPIVLTLNERLSTAPTRFAPAGDEPRRSYRTRARSRPGLSPEACAAPTARPCNHAVARPDPARSGTAGDPARVG